ncbi:hypothetical protein BN85403250 [Alteracholeplasma palmae J233]|uniref:Uncharacterized protein n=1 Tax=Alteracholeplasma palmae (strain ATCC 49389 / J233) TaxID=1318466 RepID=U4KK55_ALTPJ|nr:hypothetical protein [Alteracholeplasma palmae]CCV63902.1 hypothetical protein BN85403250 [Alteracholeplasma palmae J233]
MIRKAITNDKKDIYRLLKQIAKLHHNLYPDHFEEVDSKYDLKEVEQLINSPDKLVLVYEKDHQVFGYLIGWMKRVFSLMIYV